MVPCQQILAAIRNNPRVRIVQRIDGAAQDYGRDSEADKKQHQVNLLADLTIFQSRYCHYSTREKFPVILQDGPIIYNPVDVELFTPNGPKRYFPHTKLVAAVTWSKNPMKGAVSVYEVAKKNPEIGFVLCGNFQNAPNIENVYSLGVLDHTELAKALRSCDVLTTFSQNEACPNHVLEALASGLPILYLDSGATSEVVGDAGLPVVVDDFATQLELVLCNKKSLSSLARHRAVTKFAPGIIFPKYMEAIEIAMNSPLKVPMVRRLLKAYLNFQ